MLNTVLTKKRIHRMKMEKNKKRTKKDRSKNLTKGIWPEVRFLLLVVVVVRWSPGFGGWSFLGGFGLVSGTSSTCHLEAVQSSLNGSPCAFYDCNGAAAWLAETRLCNSSAPKPPCIDESLPFPWPFDSEHELLAENYAGNFGLLADWLSLWWTPWLAFAIFCIAFTGMCLFGKCLLPSRKTKRKRLKKLRLKLRKQRVQAKKRSHLHKNQLKYCLRGRRIGKSRMKVARVKHRHKS